MIIYFIVLFILILQQIKPCLNVGEYNYVIVVRIGIKTRTSTETLEK